jgi:hypothetical protein
MFKIQFAITMNRASGKRHYFYEITSFSVYIRNDHHRDTVPDKITIYSFPADASITAS